MTFEHGIVAAVNAYLSAVPADNARLRPLIQQMDNSDEIHLGSRKSMPGHITGSAVILNGDDSQVLLIEHKILKRWLFPGGHLDPGETPLSAALREAIEETGAGVVLHPAQDTRGVPIDIDIQVIPPNPGKGEGEHFHYDCRFLLRASDATISFDAGEVTDARWFPVDVIPSFDQRIADYLKRVFG